MHTLILCTHTHIHISNHTLLVPSNNVTPILNALEILTYTSCALHLRHRSENFKQFNCCSLSYAV